MTQVDRTPPPEPDGSHIRMPWARSDRLVPRTVLRPLQEFLDTSIAGSVLLLGAVVVALVWANSPWSESYARLWETHLNVQLGDLFQLDHDLHFWVNDGLMALFFLVVGLEIKREVTSGELRMVRTAILPVVAAIGGMAVPALVYLAIAGGGESGRGWGIPMATDIAFALGVLAVAARYASPSLKPLLLTLAIADDVGAILVIAVFYTGGGITWASLAGAVVVVSSSSSRARIHVRAQMLYVGLGVVLWYLTYRAGIHPTIAGVVLGLVTPAQPLQRPSGSERRGASHRRRDGGRSPATRRRRSVVDATGVALSRGGIAAGSYGARAAAMDQLRDPATVRIGERWRRAFCPGHP